MLTTVEGVFKDGKIELREVPSTEQARVLVTFLPREPSLPTNLPARNRQQLELVRQWRKQPLSDEDAAVLDDFEAFQARHPIRFSQVTDSSEG